MLQDLTTPLSARQARHLLRRACSNADPDKVSDVTGRIAREVVEEWLAEPLSTTLIPGPSWRSELYPPTTASSDEVNEFTQNNRYWVQEIRELWLEDLLSGTLRARMTLFWHNHFVTDVLKYRYGTLAHAYVQRLTFAALADFKAMALGFVTDGSMLYYLDGRFNRKSAPNENFARELLELFLMGQHDADGNSNYTQEDIVEAARALTGWTMNVRSSWISYKLSRNVDAEEKTIFGQTGNFDHEDLIDLIFTERKTQVASYLSRTLLAEFLFADPPRELVDTLAERVIAHDFRIGPIMADILSSEVFFDSQYEGACIKSPVEYLLQDVSAFKGNPSANTELRTVLTSVLSSLGQTLLSPPNVAGWPGYHSWLSTDTVPARWSFADLILNSSAAGVDYPAVIDRYVEPGDPYPAVSMALNLAEAMFAVPLELVEVPEMEQPFSGNLDQFPFPDDLMDGPAYRINLVKLFLGATPWYEWNPNDSLAWIMVRNFVVALCKFPEYQLT
ncbi:MAG: DUF1800 family protein [Bacteroidetes bacterium]|nr:DUF1800 family protein [Bacteroidota bacterium]